METRPISTDSKCRTANALTAYAFKNINLLNNKNKNLNIFSNSCFPRGYLQNFNTTVLFHTDNQIHMKFVFAQGNPPPRAGATSSVCPNWGLICSYARAVYLQMKILPQWH